MLDGKIVDGKLIDEFGKEYVKYRGQIYMTKKDFENRVTGEENKRLHETKVFKFRNYIECLPTWAQQEYFGK